MAQVATYLENLCVRLPFAKMFIVNEFYLNKYYGDGRKSVST